MRKTASLVVLLTCFLATADACGANVADSAAHPGFVKKVLDNGLVILCQENHAAPVAVVQAFVRAGSIFEAEYMGAGISHFCEHLVSGGSTKTRPETKTTKLLDELGGANNAYTSTDRTTYFIRTTKDKFDVACQLIADWMQNAALTQEEFDRERKVIQREIEKGKVEPSRVLWKLAQKTKLSFHPARHPVIGYTELFQKLTREDVVKYYRRMYTPGNMVIVAVGDFDAARAAARIGELFKNATQGGRVTTLPPEDPAQQGTRRAVIEMDVKSAYMLMSFRTIPLAHQDLYPLDVMAYILTRGRSSRLVQRVREREVLADSVLSWSHTPWFGTGSFDVRMVLKPGNIAEAQTAVLAELDRLKTEKVTHEELARAKKQNVANDVFGRQTIEQQAAELGGNYLATGNPFYDELYLRRLRAVTADQIQDVARKYLTRENMTVVMIRPTKKTQARSAARPLGPSKVDKLVLPNGLRLLIKRNPNVPLVTIQGYFLAGVLQENEQTAGTSRLLGKLFTRGTKTRTALDISRTLDNMAGSLTGGSGNNTVFLRAAALTEDFDKMMELYADCLLNPVFPEAELDKIKTLALHAIARQQDSWHNDAHNLMRETLFKVSPYRLNPLGTPQSVKAVTRDALVAFHRRTCVGRNGVIAVFGDLDVQRAKALLTRLFKDLPAGKGPLEVAAPKDKPLEKDRLATRNSKKPGTAVVYAAYPTCSMDQVKDRDALLVLDGVMSGVGWPGGWLHEELRGKGLVYVVHAYNFHGLRSPGYMGIYALTRPEKVDEAVSILDRNIARARRERVPTDEFERAKKMAITVELLGRQTNQSLATTAALDELYGLGYDFSDSFAERMRAVTREEVLRVAKKYLNRRVLVITRPGEKPES